MERAVCRLPGLRPARSLLPKAWMAPPGETQRIAPWQGEWPSSPRFKGTDRPQPGEPDQVLVPVHVPMQVPMQVQVQVQVQGPELP